LRRFDERAAQKDRGGRAGWLAAVFALALLAGCANEGIWPKEPLPPVSPGPPLPYPGFQSRETGTDDERGVLTEIEREELEARLAASAREREKGVERSIQKGAPKAK